MVQNILNNANKFLSKKGLSLPKRGIFVGQAAASLYLNEIGFDKHIKNVDDLVINDIDVFVMTKNSSNSEMMQKKENARLEKVLEYGRFFGSYRENSYRVERTKHLKDLNVTFYSSANNEKLTPLEIIEKFDINCTQVAIDLETKEMFITDAFKRFIETGHLEITDIATPVHSVIRIAKKAKEFGNYCDFEKEFAKLTISYTSSVYFAENYYKSFLDNRELIEKYFSLAVVNPKKEWTFEGSDNYWKVDKLYTLNKKQEEVFCEYNRFETIVGDGTRESIMSTSEIFFNQSEARNFN